MGNKCRILFPWLSQITDCKNNDAVGAEKEVLKRNETDIERKKRKTEPVTRVL